MPTLIQNITNIIIQRYVDVKRSGFKSEVDIKPALVPLRNQY